MKRTTVIKDDQEHMSVKEKFCIDGWADLVSFQNEGILGQCCSYLIILRYCDRFHDKHFVY